MKGFLLRKGIAAFCAAIVCFSFSGCAERTYDPPGYAVLHHSESIYSGFVIKGPDGEVALTHEHVRAVELRQIDYAYHVQILFNNAGATLFAQLTRENIGENIGIYVDGTLLLNPAVVEEISEGSTLVNMDDLQAAKALFDTLTN